MELQSAEQVWSRMAAAMDGAPGPRSVVASDGDGTLWSGDVGEDLEGAGEVEARVVEGEGGDAGLAHVEPASASAIPCLTTRSRTWVRLAPSEIRIPISCERCVTE